MKKIFLIAFLFISFVANAQDQTLGRKTNTVTVPGKLAVDRTLIIPTDTTFSKDGIARIGTVFYVGNGEYWTAIAGTGTIVVGSATIDSVTFNNLQICTWFGGVSDCLDQNRVHADATTNYNGTKILYYNLRGDLLPDSVSLPHTGVWQGTGVTLRDTLNGDIVISANPGGTTTSYEAKTATGSTTVTFTDVPANYNDYDIIVNGQILTPILHYTTVGNGITMPGLKPGDEVMIKRKK